MPLQSGSDRVLQAMRRSYRQERYLGIIDRVRAAMPDAAITTDIIVGLPGRDRGRLRADARRRAGGPVRRRVHVPVLPAARHPGRRRWTARCRRPSCRSATSGWSQLQDDIVLGGEQDAGRPRARRPRRRGRGPQGRRDAPPVRPRPRQPARALQPRRPRRRSSAPSRRHRDRPGHLRRTAPPGRRRSGPRASAAPGPATPGSRARRRGPHAGVLLGMPTMPALRSRPGQAADRAAPRRARGLRAPARRPCAGLVVRVHHPALRARRGRSRCARATTC